MPFARARTPARRPARRHARTHTAPDGASPRHRPCSQTARAAHPRSRPPACSGPARAERVPGRRRFTAHVTYWAGATASGWLQCRDSFATLSLSHTHTRTRTPRHATPGTAKEGSRAGARGMWQVGRQAEGRGSQQLPPTHTKPAPLESPCPALPCPYRQHHRRSSNAAAWPSAAILMCKPQAVPVQPERAHWRWLTSTYMKW